MDAQVTHSWLKSGRLRAKIEALVVAAQNGFLYTKLTKAYRRRVLKAKIAEE